MAMRDDAWAALNRGQYDRAEDLFSQLFDSEPETALMGLGRIYLKQGKYAEALDCAETLIERNQSALTLGLYAEALGALGRRKEAEDWLLLAISEAPRDGYLRVLLGEQRIRRGRWDEGASEIIAGLGMPNRERAFQHLKKVLADLTEAVAASKVRADEAQKFVNKVDYNIAGKSQEMAEFFGGVRRSLNSRQVIPDELLYKRQAAARRNEPQPAEQPPTIPQSRSRPPQSRNEERGRSSQTVREYSLAPDSPAVPKRSRQSKEPELLSLMRHDRSLNEALQAEIDPIELPVWPSNDVALDPIPALRPQLLGYDGNPIKQAQLHMTSGSVDSEIAINRAVVLLLAEAARGSSRAPTFSLRGLTQLEVQCWDGLLDNLPPVPAVYGDDQQIDEKELALGSFVGRCATLGNATWRFAENPTDSTVTLGKTVVQPFKVARAWLQAGHPDEIYLEEPVEQLLQAAGDSFQLAAVIDDSTFELTEKALNLRLAELWMAFRSHPTEVSQVQIASDVMVLEDSDEFIVFGLDEKWAPNLARGPKGLAKLSGSDVPIAYRRLDGLFLVLASRKHFGRFLECAFEAITPQNAPQILEYVQKYHRNGANVVRSEDALSRDREGATHLSFEIHTNDGVEKRRISHNPRDPIAWRFQ